MDKNQLEKVIGGIDSTIITSDVSYIGSKGTKITFGGRTTNPA